VGTSRHQWAQTAFPTRLSYHQSCAECDDRCGGQRWARVFPGHMASQPRYDSSLIFNPNHAHPDVEQTVPDTAIWTQIKPDTLHRRLSHSSAQVGSYLFISGGHDGSEYSPELLLFNLGKLPSLITRSLQHFTMLMIVFII